MVLSDDVCNGLQVVEHLQDVAEDAARGRVYLPRRTCARCGVGRRRAGRSLGPVRPSAGWWPSRPAGPAGCSARARSWPPPCPGGPGWRSPASPPAGWPPSTPSWTGATTSSGDALPARPAALRPAPRSAVVGAACARGGGSGGVNRQDAYAECEAITRREAKNFAYGIRLLRRPSARPSRPSTPWPGGSTTSATATRPAGRAPRRTWPRCARSSTTSAPTTDDPVLVAVADAAAPLRAARWRPSAS